MSLEANGIVLYDFLLVKGGAEAISLLLAQSLAAGNLGVGYRLPELFPDRDLDHIRLFDLAARTDIIPWRYVKVTRAFAHRTAFLGSYDWVLYSGSCTPVAIHHHLAGRNIYYCHALPSFAYELQDYYLARLPAPLRPALRMLIAWFRPRYETALAAMDAIVANSANTQTLLRDYLQMSSTVVHPPVDTHRFHWREQGSYYLSTARLEPHKRIEIIIDAFRRMPDKTLIVAGWGSDGETLQRRAADSANIQFRGWVSSEQMQRLLGSCVASIYLGKNEPFGISPVESMAAGKPVIGVAEGGLLETVVDGVSGVLIPSEPTVESLIEAVRRTDADRAKSMRFACEARAALFNRETFFQKMRNVIGIATT